MATFWLIQRIGPLHLKWQVVTTYADAICSGPQSTEERKRRGEKQDNIQK